MRRILPRSVRIDYEADFVNLGIARRANIDPALTAIYERLGWDQAELAELAPKVLSFKCPRAHPIRIGDVFRIPVTGELFALGQVLYAEDIGQTIAVFPPVAPRAELKADLVKTTKPLTILHVIGVSLLKGEWRP